jgi:hypothetical protein
VPVPAAGPTPAPAATPVVLLIVSSRALTTTPAAATSCALSSVRLPSDGEPSEALVPKSIVV